VISAVYSKRYRKEFKAFVSLFSHEGGDLDLRQENKELTMLAVVQPATIAITQYRISFATVATEGSKRRTILNSSAILTRWACLTATSESILFFSQIDTIYPVNDSWLQRLSDKGSS
jgi:hypothetical protein